MKGETKENRRRQIEEAAYALIEERGFHGASMLNIARRAKASNETLYKWYGGKVGLFKVLVARNAMAAKRVLENSIKTQTGVEAALRSFGPVLLQAILHDRAISLNRAAAADPSGELSLALAEAGRDTITALLHKLLSRRGRQGAFSSTDDIVQTYLGLLVGDMQIRRLIGIIPAPSARECRQTSERALRKLLVLMNNPPTDV